MWSSAASVVRSRAFVALAATLALGGCSFLGLGGDPDLTGRYVIDAVVEGQSTSATIELNRTETGYEGSVSSPQAGFSVSSVTRLEEGGWLIRASGSQGALEIRMTLDGDRVSGTWGLGPMGGTFTGERVEDEVGG